MQDFLGVVSSAPISIFAEQLEAAAELHGRNADELVAMTKRGLTPIEAIRAATTNAAELLAWPDRVGSVEAGKYADLIAVEGSAGTRFARAGMGGGERVRRRHGSCGTTDCRRDS
jgi:imidazolonepropionase-like amidohydrolase